MLSWSLLLLCASASASDAALPEWMEPESLELQIPDDAQWAQRHREASSMANAGLWLTGLGVAGTAGGALLLESGNTDLEGLGALLVVGGIGAGLTGAPVLLGSGLRANHTLSRRGVFSSTLPGTLGWAALGAWLFPAILATPLGPAAPVVIASTAWAGAVGLGVVQLHVNRRAAERAGLWSPRGARARLDLRVRASPRGLALDATF